MLKATTGVSCPSCGITRSIVELCHGHLADSFRFHPLGPALFALLLVALAYPVLPRAARDRIGNALRSPSVAVACVVAIVGVWVVRLWTGTIPP